jgi:hypothetical protein
MKTIEEVLKNWMKSSSGVKKTKVLPDISPVLTGS